MQLLAGHLVLSPSDLTAFLACEHRSGLDRAVALGERPRPHRDDPELEVLRRRGDQHEQAELARLRAAGHEIVEIQVGGATGRTTRTAPTSAATARG